MVALSALMKDDMGHQSHNENMGNDVFVSAFNQVTDILFAVTALKPLRDADVHAGLFYAAVAIFAANVLARAAAVAYQVYTATRDTAGGVGGYGGSVCSTAGDTLWLLLGALVSLAEPVSGHWLVSKGIREWTATGYAATHGHTRTRSDVDYFTDGHYIEMQLYLKRAAKVRGRVLVDVVMVVLEDVPSLGLDVAFLYLYLAGELPDGVLGSDSDVYLFVFAIALSLTHAAKGLWAAYRLRAILRKADKYYRLLTDDYDKSMDKDHGESVLAQVEAERATGMARFTF